MLRLCLIGFCSSLFVLSAGCGPKPAMVVSANPEASLEPIVLADASAIQYMIQGERFFMQKRYRQAADYFRLALVHDSYSSHLHLRLAKALGHANAWLGALQVLEKAQVACSGNSEVRLALGKLYLETADYDAVETLLKPAGLESQAYSKALLMRLDAALWGRRLVLAQEIRALALKEFPDMSCSMAVLLEDHGLEKQALIHYRRCSEETALALSRLDFRVNGGALPSEFKTVPVNPRVNLQRSFGVLSPTELYQQGVELRRAHRLSPGDCRVLYRLGSWYQEKKDRASSLRYLKEAYRRCANHPAIAITLAWAYWSQGDRNQARGLSQRVLEGGYPAEFVSAAKEIIERSDSVQAK